MPLTVYTLLALVQEFLPHMLEQGVGALDLGVALAVQPDLGQAVQVLAGLDLELRI